MAGSSTLRPGSCAIAVASPGRPAARVPHRVAPCGTCTAIGPAGSTCARRLLRRGGTRRAARRARPRPARRAVGRRPGGDHHLLDPRRRLRLRAAVGADRLDGGADPVPRARRAHRRRHRPRPAGARARALRRARGARSCWSRCSWPTSARRARSSPAWPASLGLAGVPKLVSVPLAAVGRDRARAAGRASTASSTSCSRSAPCSPPTSSPACSPIRTGARRRRGLVVPSVPAHARRRARGGRRDRHDARPWGLAFIGSYAADKRLPVDELGYERADVVVGSLLTGVIGLFVIVACAATLHGHPSRTPATPRRR